MPNLCEHGRPYGPVSCCEIKASPYKPVIPVSRAAIDADGLPRVTVRPQPSAMEQLDRLLDGRSVGVHAGGLYWDRLAGYPYLTEAEARKLCSLFVLLALEMTA